MTDTNIYALLTREWHAQARSRRGRAALARWQASHPVLAGCPDLPAVIATCHRRDDQRRAHNVLAALVGLAPDDDLAALSALQALLPGLAALSRRARLTGRFIGQGRPWATVRDLDHELVALTFERLRTGIAVDHPWPATRLLDSVWRRVRTLAQTHRRQREREAALSPATEIASAPWRTGHEQLAADIAEAVRAGRLRRGDGQLIVLSRVLGHTPRELAAASGRDVRAVRKQRARAEATFLRAAS